MSRYAAPAWCKTTLPERFGIGVKSLGGEIRRDVQYVNRVLPVIVSQIGDGQPQVHPSATGRHLTMATRPVSITAVTRRNQSLNFCTQQSTPGTTTPPRTTETPTPSYYLPAYGPQPLVSEIRDGQIQAPVSSKKTSMTMVPVSTINDGQVQAPMTKSIRARSMATTAASSNSGFKQACRDKSSLSMSLTNGTLIDNKDRTGYIASNRQMQFDAPPQAGALFTAGWAVCEGYLALGPSTYFWQCRSGDFYNLYDQLTAEQCDAIHLEAVELVEC